MNRIASGEWVTRRRTTAAAIITAAGGVVMMLVLWSLSHGSVDPLGRPLGTDFAAFWHAGLVANSGHAASAYDPGVINASLRATHGTDYPMAWVYPPTFLFIASPLARLPYVPALFLWSAIGLGAIGMVLAAILPNRRALMVALASPLTPAVIGGGQNAFLSAGLLGAGLILLDRRPAAAGGVFGLLTYKPQMGIGIAPLLLIDRQWRAIAAAIATTAVLIGLSALLWGVDSWKAFPRGLFNGRQLMEQGASDFAKSASMFSLARLWGGSIQLAYVVQATGLLLGLFTIWRFAKAGPAVRNAGVCAAVGVSTPYLMDYDMATIGLGAAFLYTMGAREGFQRYERSALAFIWIAPLFSRPAAQFLLVPLGPVATLLLLWLVMRRATAAPDTQSIAIPPLT
ncbi:MAG: glycosyltransferase family 87 protein [Sphingomicrobium sp.]